MLPFK